MQINKRLFKTTIDIEGEEYIKIIYRNKKTGEILDGDQSPVPLLFYSGVPVDDKGTNVSMDWEVVRVEVCTY